LLPGLADFAARSRGVRFENTSFFDAFGFNLLVVDEIGFCCLLGSPLETILLFLFGGAGKPVAFRFFFRTPGLLVNETFVEATLRVSQAEAYSELESSAEDIFNNPDLLLFGDV